jgi:signal transduction histidine kinase
VSVRSSSAQVTPAGEPTAAERVVELERKLAARDKTIAALIRRADEHAATNQSGFAVLQQNIALEDVVTRKTRELESERLELQKALSELRATQARLLQAQKLESIGQLAAGIAHEINTPTQYVSDNVTFLKRAMDSLLDVLDASLAVVAAAEAAGVAREGVAAVAELTSRARLEWLRRQIPAALEQSQEGVNRITTIVGAMKTFSHPSFGEKEAVELDDLIRTTITVSRNEWKYVADLDIDFDPTLPAVPCLRNEISQVVLNLIINAAHAITAKRADSAGRGCIRVVTRRTADAAEIRIEDDGTGIPDSIRERVFDPFFTTKPVGKGTGQGLAIVYSAVVERHGGQVSFETEVGKGTTFIVRLPLRPSPEGEV